MEFIHLSKNKDEIYVYDGSQPFVHWFDGPLSTNLLHYKVLCWKHPSATCSISIEDTLLDPKGDAMIGIYNPTAAPKVDVGGMEFDNIEEHLTDSIVLTNSDGDVVFEKDGMYYFVAYLICKSNFPGELIWNVTISNETIQVGGEFYDEQEALKLNLENFGVEIPNEVVKSLYPSDMYNESVDNILMNRKWKELLMNYVDIRACKGSYKSLINSLKWFEYGDLVELREIWKYETPDGTKYFDRPLNQIYTPEFDCLLSSATKTTTFYLRNLIDQTQYKDSELDDTAKNLCKWSLEEMKLKMLLLGNFYETFFMPVHTELKRSVCEEVIKCVDIKVSHGVDELEPKPISVFKNLRIEVGKGSDYVWDLGNVEVIKNVEDCKLKNGGLYLDVFELSDKVTPTDDNVKNFDYFGGVGVVVPFKLIGEDGGKIIKVKIISEDYLEKFNTLNNSGEVVSFSDVEIKYDGIDSPLEFKLIFTEEKDYRFEFEVWYESGDKYKGDVNISIQDNLYADLMFKAVTWKGIDRNPFEIEKSDGEKWDTITENDINWERYMFIRDNNEEYGKRMFESWEEVPKFYIPASLNFNKGGNGARLIPMTVYTYRAKEKPSTTFESLWDGFWKKVAGSSPDYPTDLKAEENGWTGDVNIQGKLYYWRLGTSEITVNDTRVFSEGDSNEVNYWIWIKIVASDGSKLDTDVDEWERFTNDVFFPEFHTLTDISEIAESGCLDNKKYPVIIQPYLSTTSSQKKHLMFSKHVKEPWEIISYNYRKNDKFGFDYNTTEPFIAKEYNWEPLGYYKVTFRYRFSDKEDKVKTITKNTPFKYKSYS